MCGVRETLFFFIHVVVKYTHTYMYVCVLIILNKIFKIYNDVHVRTHKTGFKHDTC